MLISHDTANLSRKINGLATEAVTATLGQSKQAYDKGITSAYMGSTSSDTWASRVEEDFQDPCGLPIADTPMVKRGKRLTSSEVSTLKSSFFLMRSRKTNDKTVLRAVKWKYLSLHISRIVFGVTAPFMCGLSMAQWRHYQKPLFATSIKQKTRREREEACGGL